MNTFTTQAQQFAAVYAGKLAKRQLRTIAIVSFATKLITAGVAVISYRHQSQTLLGWEAPAEIAYGLPGLVDLLTIVCVLAISTPALIPAATRVAGRVVVIPVLTSAAINFCGHGSIGVKLAALSLPIFIPLGELVGSVLKPDFAEMDRIERAAYAVAAPAAAPEVDEQAKARRSEIARKAAAKRRENAEAAKAQAEEKRDARRVRAAAKRLEAIAPTSSGHPAVVLSAADKDALAHLAAKR
ncbi:MAG TPA: hypothetical protein VFC19_49175 [Candidatus Limnocylindrales bacterium]|nr:hypothetical protein [Candidatus Limnocylindrales bacterium]